MSMTKREIDEQNSVAEMELSIARKSCGCRFEWSDKFWILCDKHAEAEPVIDWNEGERFGWSDAA